MLFSAKKELKTENFKFINEMKLIPQTDQRKTDSSCQAAINNFSN